MKSVRHLLTILFVSTFVFSGAIHAQAPQGMVTIGFWSYPGIPIVKEEMAKLGYEEGVNVSYMYFTEDMLQETPENAQALVDAKVDVIITLTELQSRTLTDLTSEIPIVFTLSDDPVGAGIIEDLVRPGTNATGNITTNPHTLKLQILADLDPSISKVGFLFAANNPTLESLQTTLNDLADQLDINYENLFIADAAEGIALVENFPDDIDWLFMTPFLSRAPDFRTALYTAVPEKKFGIAEVLAAPVQGVAMGFGPDTTAAYAQTAEIVDRILRGASPAELPIQPVDNAFMINLETAEQIGLEVPVNVLRLANVIVRPGFFDN